MPQTLAIAVMLLYVNAAFALLAVLGLGIGGSTYELLPLIFINRIDSLDSYEAAQAVAGFGSGLAYGFAGLAMANSQRIGWKVGVVVAAGAVLLPVVALARGIDLGVLYVITFAFDAALLAALLHPQSRQYERMWFEGPTRRR